MSPACGAAGREGPPHPHPALPRSISRSFLSRCGSTGALGLISGIVPLFIFMDDFVCPPPALSCSQRLGAVPPMLPPGACCDVTPVEGAGEWNWRSGFSPGPNATPTSSVSHARWSGRRGEKMFLKRENRWEKSCGVQAKFVFWLEVRSGSNLLSHCASCPSGSSAAVPLPGHRDSPAER